jgi:hypothetical protein
MNILARNRFSVANESCISIDNFIARGAIGRKSIINLSAPIGWDQGCQIFIYTIYQNGENYTKLQLYYQMAIKYNKCPYYVYSKKSISKPSKIYPSCDFLFENIPSGNPGWDVHVYFKALSQGMRYSDRESRPQHLWSKLSPQTQKTIGMKTVTLHKSVDKSILWFENQDLKFYKDVCTYVCSVYHVPGQK